MATRTLWCVAGVALIALAACEVAMAAGKCQKLIATGSPDAPPFLWRDPQDPQRLVGASADVLAQLGTELGVKIELLYGGRRSDALAQVRSGRMDLLADQPLLEAELEHLDYVYPALVQNDYWVWARRDAAHAHATLADLHGERGAVSAKARLTPAFSRFADDNLNLERPENLTRTFQRLVLGQVDYIIAPRFAGQAMTQTLGITQDVQASEVPIDRPGLYLALGHDSACNDAWLRGQLAKKMTELAATGQMQGILQRNVERWRAEQARPASTAKP